MTTQPDQGTIAEQLLGALQGEHVTRDVDLVYSHDATTPLSIDAYHTLFEPLNEDPTIRRPENVAIVFDHAYPPPNATFAEHQQRIREFMDTEGIQNFYAGDGICHLVLPENGHVDHGDIVLGADSHTVHNGPLGCFATGVGSTDIAIAWATGRTWFRVPPTLRVNLEGTLAPDATAKDIVLTLAHRIGPDGATYQAIEYGGPGWHDLDMDARFTLANMTVDLGAKAATCETDDATNAWLEAHGAQGGPPLRPDPQATYTHTLTLTLDDVEPLVSGPHKLEALQPAREMEGLEIDRVVIGSCTNARTTDLAQAARVLEGSTVNVETLIVPGSTRIARQARSEGTLEALEDAGCTVLAPGCGPCLGRHQGVLAPGQRCLTTHNRNPPGRMGSPQAEIYLASPIVAAASAHAGRITPPRQAPLIRGEA